MGRMRGDRESVKAVLVVDMPRDCWDCHLTNLEFYTCSAVVVAGESMVGKSVKEFDKGERPSWCPLKPFPAGIRGATNPYTGEIE